MKEGYYQDQTISWLPVENSRGLIILGHGLNIHPFKMRSLADFFHSLRLDVVLLSLSGHNEKFQLDEVNAERWEEDTKEALRFAEKVAFKKSYPYYFCGFSLSCLMIQRLLQQSQWNLSKQILLAPALAVQPTVRMSFPLMALPLNIKTKSFGSIGYRYSGYLTLKTYGALRKSYLRYRATTKERTDIPTLVFHRKTDETVSARGLKRICEKLENWTFHPIAPQQTGYWQHLIIDKTTMGAEDWAKFQQNVKTFLI